MSVSQSLCLSVDLSACPSECEPVSVSLCVRVCARAHACVFISVDADLLEHLYVG